MKFIPTILALALLAGLTAYVNKYEQEPLADISVPKVAQTDKSKIVKVELEETAKKQKVVLERGKDDKWQITAPLKSKPEDEKVDNLLTRLEKIKADRLVEGDTPGKAPDLAKYGLDNPSHKVSWTAEGAPRTVLIGKDSPLGTNAYVKMADDAKVFLVNSGDLEILKKDLYTFRDKTVLKADKDQIKQLDVARDGGESWRFSHAADGGWTIDEPLKAAGDSQAIGDMAGDLGRLRAEEFTAETTSDLKPYGLDKPAITVKIVMKEDGATKTVFFGKRKETDSARIYAKRESEPIVYLVDASLIKALGNKVDEFRDKSILRLGEREITALSVEKGSEKVVAARAKDGKWSYAQSRIQSDPGSTGTQLLEKLKELKAARFISGAEVKLSEFGLTEPDYRIGITISAKPATPPVTGAKAEPVSTPTNVVALVGKVAEGGRYLKLDGETVVVVTKEDVGSQIDGFLKNYREILPIEDWNLKSVELASKDKKESYEINDKGDWAKPGQKEAVAPLKDKVRNFATTLPHLVASDWLEEKPQTLKDNGLETPELKVIVKTKDGKPDTAIRLSTSGGKFYIKLEGKAGIGLIGPDPLTRARDVLSDQTPAAPPTPSSTQAAPAPEKGKSSALPASIETPKASPPAPDKGASSALPVSGEAPKELKDLTTQTALPVLLKEPPKPASEAVAEKKPGSK